MRLCLKNITKSCMYKPDSQGSRFPALRLLLLLSVESSEGSSRRAQKFRLLGLWLLLRPGNENYLYKGSTSKQPRTKSKC